jgi:hypothetical protein
VPEPPDTYFIAHCSTRAALTETVNLLIDQGWSPMGSVALMANASWAQAMTRPTPALTLSRETALLRETPVCEQSDT